MKMTYLPNDMAAPTFASTPMLPRAGADWPYADVGEVDVGASRVQWSAYGHSMASHRWWILVVTLALTLLASVYAQSITPVYRSTATVLIESGKTKILSIEEVYNGASQDREYYQTQVEILRSHDVALRTVIATKLWDEPEFDPRIAHHSWLERLQAIVSPRPPPPAWTPQRLAEATVGKYLSAVTVEPVRLSQLVKISFDSADPELAAKMADATANSFIDGDRESHVKMSLSVSGLLQDRLSALRDKLLQSEHELQRFRESAGIVSLTGSPLGVAGQQMGEVAQQLVAARLRRTELESAEQQIMRAGGASSSLSVPAVANHPGVAEAHNRVALATIQLDEARRTLGDENTRVINEQANLAAAQRVLEAQIQAAVASLKSQVQAARDTERALDAALTTARTAVQTQNRQEFQLGVLERDVQTNKQLYELFLSRTKETSVSANLQGAVARIVDSASPGTVPLRPNKPQIVTAAGLIGFVGCSLVGIVLDGLGRTLRGTEEAESRLRIPVLAALPQVPAADAKGLPRAFLDQPKSEHSDGIRLARTSMLLSEFVASHKLILVTSALSGEGKTTFCTNLAFAQAQTKRTLLIDADLRNPQVGARLGVASDAKGFANFVRGTHELSECVHAVPGSSLLVMPAGDLPTYSEELLMSPRFKDALNVLATRVDMVLIDSPPVAACSDALLISQQVHDVIFLIKARDTPHDLAERGLQRIRRAGANIFGLVLTNVDATSNRSSWRRAHAPYTSEAAAAKQAVTLSA